MAAYQAAKAACDKAQAARDAASNDAAAPLEQRAAAAMAVMETKSAVDRIAADAVAADPKCVEAKARVSAATQKLADLVKQFEATLSGNAQWQAAKAAVDAAKQKADQAKQR